MQNTDLDILISRVVDARASATDWDSLERHAAADGGVWKTLAMAQRDQALLSVAVNAAAGRAQAVALPARAELSQEIPPTLSFAQAQLSLRTRRVATWAGWAAAAALALAFVGKQSVPMRAPASGDQQAGVGSGIANAADALNLYLDRGRADGSVIGEQPDKKIVDVVPIDGGSGYEVFYVRQILERAKVDNLYRFTSDELGRPAPLPVQPQQAQPTKRAKPAV